MARSHPPTLIKIALRTLREEIGLARGDRLLLAVSGGTDSMALLDVLPRVRDKLGIELSAHGVDHGLRAEAARELDLAEQYAHRLGVDFSRTRLTVPAGGNLQARARAARYSALREAAKKCGAVAIATAHQADDRAETVLLRLLRGAGPRGLGVLPPREGDRVRPLIRAARADVALHLQRHDVPFSADPSNLDRRFLRVRVRHEVMPLLAELSPGITQHLNALADALGSSARLLGLQQSAAEQGLELGRAHWLALARAQKLGQRHAVVRLPGGRQARVDPETGAIRVELALPGPRR